MENIKNLSPVIRFKNFTNDWEQRKVGDYYDFKNGLNKGKEFFGKGTPIVNFTDVFHNRGIYHKNLGGKVSLDPSEIRNYGVKKGDIFFTRTSETIEEIGYPSVMLDAPKDTVFSGFVLRGRTKLNEDPLDNLFKKYVFFTNVFRAEMIKKSSMTTRALTSGTAIGNMTFMHPINKAEQEKIGTFFTNIDNLITLHQRKLEKLELTKRTFFKKMFPKNTNIKQDYRFSAFTDKWELRRLRDISEIQGGYAFASSGYSEEGLYRVVTIANVSGSKYIENFGNNINISDEKIINQYLLNKDDLLISLTGNVGRVSRATGNNEMLNQRVAKIVPKKGLDYNYLETLIRDNKFEVKMTISGQGAAQKNINNDDVLDYECYIPSFAEQQRIGGIFNTIDNLITLHHRKLEQLELMKKYFLKNMFI